MSENLLTGCFDQATIDAIREAQCPCRSLTPNIIKHCSGPGDGMIGNLSQTNGKDWKGGFDINYGTINFHVPYGTSGTYGPYVCGYGSQYCSDATWTVTWA